MHRYRWNQTQFNRALTICLVCTSSGRLTSQIPVVPDAKRYLVKIWVTHPHPKKMPSHEDLQSRLSQVSTLHNISGFEHAGSTSELLAALRKNNPQMLFDKIDEEITDTVLPDKEYEPVFKPPVKAKITIHQRDRQGIINRNTPPGKKMRDWYLEFAKGKLMLETNMRVMTKQTNMVGPISANRPFFLWSTLDFQSRGDLSSGTVEVGSRGFPIIIIQVEPII